MSYTVRVTELAESHLDGIHEYIGRDSRANADRLLQRVRRELLRLQGFPLSGKAHDRGTRMLVIAATPYVAIYKVYDRTVEVIGIYHGARLQ